MLSHVGAPESRGHLTRRARRTASSCFRVPNRALPGAALRAVVCHDRVLCGRRAVKAEEKTRAADIERVGEEGVLGGRSH
jgi:hypothetical protein